MAGPLDFSFDHIHIYTSDLAATEKWFTEGLGADVAGRPESRGVPSVRLKLAGANIYLRPARADETLVAPGPELYGTNHFGLRVANVDATVEELRGRGVFIEVEPLDFSAQSRIAFIKGPDGVRIELVQART
jgi:catechol 2,3-dioxygenase-like lactoylglutathione lyase family enzyme